MPSSVVIINPVSGGGAGRVHERAELARVVFGRHAIAAGVIVTERPRHASEAAAEARRDGAQVVVAWGGDGTINEVASALVSSPTALAIVPAGSGNGLARGLRIPWNAEQALEVAATGRQRAIDVGELAGRSFLNVAGLGFDALVADRVNRRKRGTGGVLRYVVGSLREFRDYTPVEYELCDEEGRGEAERWRALVVAIANGPQYGHGAAIAPGARVDDGRLDVVIVEPRSLVRGLADARRLFNGTIAGAAGITMRQLTSATITPDRECLAHVDGEPFPWRGPASVRIHPGALRVRIP